MFVLKNEIEDIRAHVKKLEDVVYFLSTALMPPIMYDSGQAHRGYRYMKPTIQHFCVLKAVRAVSGLNACLALAEKGYNQEIGVLIRTMAECTTHIEYALAGYENGALAEPQQKFIDHFFSDFRRNSADDYQAGKLRQEEIHKAIGNFLDKDAPPNEGVRSKKSAKELLSNIYRNFSNYVHARYPEIMDMFGGTSPRFHLDGMLDTPKDRESIAIIRTFANSVSITLGFMIQKSDMYDQMMAMPEFEEWFKTQKERAA